MANLVVGWVAVLVGLLVGAIIGMFFHGDDWLGGYQGWRRRMLRLMHISLVGTGLLNLAFALSLAPLKLAEPPAVASVLLIVGAITMPLICGLSAWWKPMRHLFFIPVISLILGTVFFLHEGFLQ